jgi:hypothetical protein
MRLVFRLCWDFALCQVGKESSIYITSHEAGPGPGEQRIRLCPQTQRETNPHLLKIRKWLWNIINTRYSTAELLQSLSPRATPQPSFTITIATRYSKAELLQSLLPRATPQPNYYYRHALFHSRALQSLSPRATPRPVYSFFYFIRRIHESLIQSARAQPSSHSSCFSAISQLFRLQVGQRDT